MKSYSGFVFILLQNWILSNWNSEISRLFADNNVMYRHVLEEHVNNQKAFVICNEKITPLKKKVILNTKLVGEKAS